jgi:hypothetical protein
MNTKTKKVAYTIIRLLLGLVITPLVAGVWVVIYGLLVANGAGQAHTLGEVWTNGLVLGSVVSLALVIVPLVKN